MFLMKKLWIDSIKEQDKHKKGKKLEIFLMNFFCCNGNFELSKIRKLTDNEEIDIELKHKSNDSFWTQLNSQFVFIESKNWTSKVGSPDVKIFKDKIISHKNLCRVGFMVSVNGFTDGCETKKIRIVGQNAVLVLIDGSGINKFFEEDVSVQQFLEHMLSLAIK